jgi:hypothetical protein
MGRREFTRTGPHCKLPLKTHPGIDVVNDEAFDKRFEELTNAIQNASTASALKRRKCAERRHHLPVIAIIYAGRAGSKGSGN